MLVDITLTNMVTLFVDGLVFGLGLLTAYGVKALIAMIAGSR